MAGVYTGPSLPILDFGPADAVTGAEQGAARARFRRQRIACLQNAYTASAWTAQAGVADGTRRKGTGRRLSLGDEMTLAARRHDDSYTLV